VRIDLVKMLGGIILWKFFQDMLHDDDDLNGSKE
jgi:hypothetical protein